MAPIPPVRSSAPSSGRPKRMLLAAGIAAAAFISAGVVVAAPAVAADSYSPPAFAVGENPGGIDFTPDGKNVLMVTAGPSAFDGEVSMVGSADHGTRFSLSADINPNGVAISPDGTRAIVANLGNETYDGGITAYDLASQQNRGTAHIGMVYDLSYSPDGSEVYAVMPRLDQATGAVAVLDGHTPGAPLATIPVGRNPLSVAFTPDGGKAFVSNAGDGTQAGSISVIDVASRTVIATLPAGISPGGVAVSPDGTQVFVANWGTSGGSGSITVVDATTDTVVDTISGLGSASNAVVFSPDGGTAYVANAAAGTVSVIDASTETVVHTLSLNGWVWDLAVSPDGREVWVTIDGNGVDLSGTVAVIDVATLQWSPTVERVAGSDRFGTSVAISKKSFPGTVQTVYVATGTNFPDALSAAAAAAKEEGPLLLTAPDALPEDVKAEIQRLQPSRIVVAGGVDAVSATVLNQLKPLAASVERISGDDRFATARALIDDAFGDSLRSVYVATGDNFPDALSASAAAGAKGIPVLLVEGTASTLDAATVKFLTDRGADAFTVVGGENAVSGGIESRLASIGTVDRLAGEDRFETSQLINKDAFPVARSGYLATGLQFPDALSGAVLAAVNGGPLYVVRQACIPLGDVQDLVAGGADAVTLLGGPDALSESVAGLHNC
jgi:YVTN family beta-propeller protein